VARFVTQIDKEDHSILSHDGESEIFIRHYRKGTPKIHFLIVHGALEHLGRHDELAKFWLRSMNDNVAVTLYDHIGHGRSGGARSYVPEFKVYVEDLQRVGAFVDTKNTSETKNVICAHSLGGLITLTRVLDPSFGWSLPIKALILSSPCIRPKSIGLNPEQLLIKLDRLTPKLHLPMIYRGSDLTNDPERANDFDSDSMIPKFITVRMAKEVFDASHKIRGLSYYLKIPTLFLIAEDDRVVDAESTLLFAHGIDKRLVKTIQYPKHRHELWNEKDRYQIFETMKKWVDGILKENP
jgi:acylglycerol lipase